ncbi:MAG: hypothetical protein KIT13_09320, partial [Burkholderiales bacterium]|nr:hypothetical protein [Burkholderiales bacterium]
FSGVVHVARRRSGMRPVPHGGHADGNKTAVPASQGRQLVFRKRMFSLIIKKTGNSVAAMLTGPEFVPMHISRAPPAAR